MRKSTAKPITDIARALGKHWALFWEAKRERGDEIDAIIYISGMGMSLEGKTTCIESVATR